METSNITKILQSQKGTNGVSLYDHLQELLNFIINNKTGNINYENFEVFSELVKKNSFIYRNPKPDYEVNNIQEEMGELHDWVQKCKTLQKGLFYGTNKPGSVPNIIAESKMFEVAGIYFGEEETYRIYKSIAKLALKVNAKEIRFWGKILARNKDYYVAEGKVNTQFSDIPPYKAEAKGSGCNAFTFWVTDNVLEDWMELPLVTPEQLIVSRQIKYIFTGNLNAEINSYPPFPGQEKHLLKASIVRITYANVIAPKGLFKAKDDDPKEIEFEEVEGGYKLPEFADMSAVENWVHQNPQILKMGRVDHFYDPKLTEEEKNELQAKYEDAETGDPIAERLKGINEDQEMAPEVPAWQVKQIGELNQFTCVGREEGQTACYGVITIKNQRWPGALTVASTKGYANIYIGYGQKATQGTFYPVQPNDIQDDIEEEQEEQDEPNPKNPEQEVEPDSDDKKNEGQEGEQNEEEQ